MSRLSLAFAASAALALSGLAVPAAYAAAAPAWTVDKANSSIAWRTTFSGVGVRGGFKTWDAQIAFDPDNLAGSRVSVSIDIASVTASDLDAQEALPETDWLDAKGHPKATFVSNSFRRVADGSYLAVGTLTIKGVAKPLNLPFKLAINGNEAKMDSSVILDRSLFNVGRGQFAGEDSVPHGVTVVTTVVARK